VVDARVISKDIGLAPTFGHQSDHEFDRKACAPDYTLAG
jgi:hypothetical protein